MAFDELVKALEDALLSAYKETPGSGGTRRSRSTATLVTSSFGD